MAMALPVYAEVDLLPDAPDEVELLEDEPETASGEDTALPEQNPDPGTGSHRNGHPCADRDPHCHPGTDRTAAEDVRRRKRG